MIRTTRGRRCGLLAAPLLLGACASNFIGSAGPDQRSDAERTVITGSINYIVDGVSKAPYGAFKPAWPAPRMTAVNLRTGSPMHSPLVAEADGAFRWRLPPGAYVVTRIGMGSFGDDTLIAWPGVLLCVPPAVGRVAYAGALRLEGRSYDEERVPSTGTRYRATGVRFEMRVADERGAPPGGADPAPVMRVNRAFPIGDRLVERQQREPEVLAREACG